VSSKTRAARAESDTTPDIEQLNPDNGSSATQTPDESIRREQIFEILSNERRRLVLGYLRQHAGTDQIDFRDLVDQVAAWENDTTRNEVDSADRKCVYTALRQTHLPKLDKFGVIEYDHQRGTIESRESIQDVLRYMKHVPERERFWSRLYLLLAVLGGTAALLIWVGITPLGTVPGISVAIGIAAAFGAFSIAQIYQSYRRELHPEESE
jgi:hypothetical protein